MLEALGRLCRGVEANRFASCLRQHAPSWLAHLPVLMASSDRHDEKRAYHNVAPYGVTPARMLRELTDALEVLTAEHLLVLVLEDLHWSDQATLTWLAYVAKRRGLAHLLILGTYRPSEILGSAHPLRLLLAELQPHAQCGFFLPRSSDRWIVSSRRPWPTPAVGATHRRVVRSTEWVSDFGSLESTT